MAQRRKKSAPRKKGGRSWLWLVLAGAVVFAAGLFLGRGAAPWRGLTGAVAGTPSRPAASQVAAAPRPSRESAAPPSAAAPAATPAGTEATPDPIPAPSTGARIGLVIDDLGRSLEDLDTLAALGIPLSYAVLPFESMTPRVVARLRERRAEILLHLPMEPRGAQNPGPGALREGMSPEEIRSRTRAALEAVPGAVGVNNHMGSELSADPEALRAMLGVVAERKLFFLDSRTSPESRGYSMALELGIPAAQRQVFLDTDPREAALAGEWTRLLAVARERGAAVAIGHPHPGTLALLGREIPRARRLGYEFVPVSYLLDSRGELPE